MRVVLHSVEAVEVKTETGVSLGVFTLDSEWCGMARFVRSQPGGPEIICDTARDAVARLMPLLGVPRTVEVVKISPLLAEIMRRPEVRRGFSASGENENEESKANAAGDDAAD